jgi:hypothetical protein
MAARRTGAAALVALVACIGGAGNAQAAPVAADDEIPLPQGFQKVIIQPLVNDAGSGLTVRNVAAIGPATGDLKVSSTGVVTYTAPNSFVGTDTFTYIAENSSGDTASAVITIRVLATAKTVDDAISIDSNAPVTIDVLANDRGASIKLTTVDGSSGQGGSLVVSDGVVRYDPPGGTWSTDSFSYIITDRFGNTSQGDVTVKRSRQGSDADGDGQTSNDDSSGKADALDGLPATGLDVRVVASIGALVLAALVLAIPMGRRRRREAHSR